MLESYQGIFYVDLGNLDVELRCYFLFLAMESVGNLNAIFWVSFRLSFIMTDDRCEQSKC